MPDTIIALATPPGVGALAILRLSGPDAFRLTDQIGGKPPPRQLRHTYLRTLKWRDAVLDQAVVTYHAAPNSYTGEDAVEISCHGNPLVVQGIIEALLSLGARTSLPGEFTQRAFLNGKLDLTQAESVLEVIEAATPEALRGAQAILEGKLGTSIQAMRRRLIDLLAHLEAYIDFPDEDIQPETGAVFHETARSILADISALLATAPLGKIMREGVATAIVGAPNVGKSSLFNALLRTERSIVSPIPGTTRDLIETSCYVAGFLLRLTDTAGLRSTTDPLEAEGIRRAQIAGGKAELVLHLVDASQPAGDVHPPSIQSHQRLITIAHKADLGIHPDHKSKLPVSSVTRSGLAELEQAIRTQLTGGADLEKQGWMTVNARQSAALRRAETALESGLLALERNDPPELASLHFREALQAVGDVVGVATNEDILDSLFKKFCIGK